MLLLEIAMNTRFLSITALLCLVACATTACNTMSGIGKDTAAVGEKIEEEAERHIDDEDDRPDGASDQAGRP